MALPWAKDVENNPFEPKEFNEIQKVQCQHVDYVKKPPKKLALAHAVVQK